MSKKQTRPRWLDRKFNADEWDIIRSAWGQLLEDGKIQIGQKSLATKNYNDLCSWLQLIDDGFRKNMANGLPSDSKKYKQLHYFIEKHTYLALENDTNPLGSDDSNPLGSNQLTNPLGSNQQAYPVG